MNKPPNKLVIASRESALAMWQAKHVQAKLQTVYPHCDVQILGMTTTGDQILDTPLARIGGKGLFTKELEIALADGSADLAVHSMKDVPMNLPVGFVLVATGEREDARDAQIEKDAAVTSPKRVGPLKFFIELEISSRTTRSSSPTAATSSA